MQQLQMFIRAERSGGWNLQLISVPRMLNIFETGPAVLKTKLSQESRTAVDVYHGRKVCRQQSAPHLSIKNAHNHYARCARIYLQMMWDLHDSHSWLYEQFLCHGYHTVHRSNRYWSGLCSDYVTAEEPWRPQSWQRTDQVCSLDVDSYHAQLCRRHTAETHFYHIQHKEMGATRAKRDVTDLSKIQAWFDAKFLSAELMVGCVGLIAKQ